MKDASLLPVALFDSGVGGLTVLKALADRLPGEDLLYLGDTARLPYGTKGRETITRYTLLAARKLVDRGAKMLVVACNTATAAALPALREHFAPLPVVGVVEPGARAAARTSRNGEIVVIATEATITGGAYQQAITRIRPEAHVRGRACTLFVPMAEEGWMDGPLVEGIARRYLEDMFTRRSPRRARHPAVGLHAFSASAGGPAKRGGPAGAHCGFSGHHSRECGGRTDAPRPAAHGRAYRRPPLYDHGQSGAFCPHRRPLSGQSAEKRGC